MKKLMICAIMLCLFNMFGICAKARDVVNPQDKQLIDEYLNQGETRDFLFKVDDVIDEDFYSIMPNFNSKEALQGLIMGDDNFKPNDILGGVLKFFAKEIMNNFNLMLGVCTISILSGLILNLDISFGGEHANNIGFFACYGTVTILLIKSFSIVANMTSEVITNLSVFTNAAMAALVALNATSGNLVAAATLSPTLMWVSSIVNFIIANFFMPLMFGICALSVVNNLSNRFSIDKTISLMRQINRWALCFMLSMFVATITLRGLTSYSMDLMKAKAIKFAVTNFVPLVGGILTDAAETVFGYSVLIKNSVGVVGIVAVLAILIVPVLKIGAIILSLRLTAAIIEPICDKRMVNIAEDMASASTMAMILVICVSITSIMSLAVLIATATA